MKRQMTLAWLLAALGACSPKNDSPAHALIDAGSEAPLAGPDASFAQAASCSDAPPRTFEPVDPSGPWPIQIGVPSEGRVFNLFGPGCDIPVVGTLQGNQYARLAVRFTAKQSLKVFAQFTLRSLITPDAGAARDNNYSLEQTGICKDDGYCYVTPVLANIVQLADEQDALRGHAVQLDVHVFEAANKKRFGRIRTWGRLLLPD